MVTLLEFSLLNQRHMDVVCAQEFCELSSLGDEPINIELKDIDGVYRISRKMCNVGTRGGCCR